jgi:hypothetical protein
MLVENGRLHMCAIWLAYFWCCAAGEPVVRIEAASDFPRVAFLSWDTEGGEGYLADSFRFLQAVLLRGSTFRRRLFRPMKP